MACASVPSAANGNQGQNTAGWCNEEASALMTESDQTVDETERADLIHQIGQLPGRRRGHAAAVPVPEHRRLAHRPGRWPGRRRTPPTTRAFQNINEWEDTNGDGQIVIGAEQWPECLNPITECANSSWYVWTTAFKVLPDRVATPPPTVTTRRPSWSPASPSSTTRLIRRRQSTEMT